MRTALLTLLLLVSGCVADNQTPVSLSAKALSDIKATVKTDVDAFNNMFAKIEADLAAVVKKQQQSTNDGGAGNEGGVGLGAHSRYYSGAGLLALMWALERLTYWGRRWQKRSK